MLRINGECLATENKKFNSPFKNCKCGFTLKYVRDTIRTYGHIF